MENEEISFPAETLLLLDNAFPAEIRLPLELPDISTSYELPDTYNEFFDMKNKIGLMKK